MAQGNKGFADLVSGAGAAPKAPARLPPRSGFLAGRENRLADLAAGGVVNRLHENVDPARCRIWSGHNRDYEALNEVACADLIESFRAQGRQEVPAIVRRVSDDPAYDFEVICGARRHWTATWLRAHNYPDFKFVVEPRELTDEEAFRLADLENRSRKDLSDYERAADYARAIERYYGGSQQRMAERLQVSKSWLSRYLELAKLPAEVIAGFGSPHVIGIKHAATLAPLLRVPVKRARLISKAENLAKEQSVLREKGEQPLPAASVLRALVEAAEARTTPGGKRDSFEIRDPKGAVIVQCERGRRGGFTLSVPASAPRDRSIVLSAIEEIVDQLYGSQGKGDR